jgi:hypothetical protein
MNLSATINAMIVGGVIGGFAAGTTFGIERLARLLWRQIRRSSPRDPEIDSDDASPAPLTDAIRASGRTAR